MRSRCGSAKRGMLRRRSDASGWRGRCCRNRRVHLRGRRRCRQRHLNPRKRRRSCLCRRPWWNHRSQYDGCGWFRFSRDLGCNWRRNNGRRDGLRLRRPYDFRNWRFRFLFISRGSEIENTFNSWDVSRRLWGARLSCNQRRSAYRFRSFLLHWHSRSRYLGGLGLNRRTHGLRRFVGWFRSRGRCC